MPMVSVIQHSVPGNHPCCLFKLCPPYCYITLGFTVHSSVVLLMEIWLASDLEVFLKCTVVKI